MMEIPHGNPVTLGAGRSPNGDAGAPHLWMRPVRPEDMPKLRELAQADGHAVLHPTHVFLKDGEIVGCASVVNIPMVLPWFSTEKCHARDSKYFINQMENFVANCMGPEHHGVLCVPFFSASPFQKYIHKLGYTDAGQFSLTFKKVK